MCKEELAAFKEVVRTAMTHRNVLRGYLEKGRRLDYPARLVLASMIKSILLEIRPELDQGETRRFSEIITGVADRINTEFKDHAADLIDPEMNHFKNTRRAVVLDETYDIYNAAFAKQKSLITEFVNSDLPDDKELARKYNTITSLLRNLNNVPTIIQRDIEIGLNAGAKAKEENELTDRHLDELQALHNEYGLKENN